MNVLLLYLGITVAGYVTGACLRKRNITIKAAGTIQTIAIILLVFIMGSRIGSDKEIVNSLGSIGLISFALTVFILAGSVAAVFLVRRLLGFDNRGELYKQSSGKNEAGIHTDADEARFCESAMIEQTNEESEKTDHKMTICIVCAVALGIAAGRMFLPESFIAVTGALITAGLCLLLFFVGTDIGIAGTIISNFRQAGWRVIVFPFVIMAGTFIGAAAASVFLPLSVKDALCVGAGFGWYSLAPAMLAEYSVKVSAISFMHNVMRELFGILLIPFVANKIGYMETFALPGSPSMDVCLPVIEKATKADIAVYSFISGAVLSAAVPVIVSIVMNI